MTAAAWIAAVILGLAALFVLILVVIAVVVIAGCARDLWRWRR
ncbi:hypothetical protein ACQP60_04270 [Isoptericola variabilis]